MWTLTPLIGVKQALFSGVVLMHAKKVVYTSLECLKIGSFYDRRC